MSSINSTQTQIGNEHIQSSCNLQERPISKLSTSQIFDRIRPLICSVDSELGEASGFLLNKTGTMLTVAHNLPRDDGKFSIEAVQINASPEDMPYFPSVTYGLNEEKAIDLDICSLESGMRSSELETIPLLPEDIKLREGMKVYFAGYPLGQSVVTFHKGIISSIKVEENINRFTIDGTVVPGNSGGPVLIQEEGNIYLAGMITSEITDLSSEDQKTIRIMKELKAYSDSHPHTNSGGVNFDFRGASIDVSVPTPDNPNAKERISTLDSVVLSYELFEKNLSTGIGQAIDLRHYNDLFKESATPQRTSYSFPTGKGKGLITDSIPIEHRDTKKPLDAVKYMELRYGKGGGNRGIVVTFPSSLKGEKICYKFSPNPHTSGGNYNKNQKELYFNAAKKIVEFKFSIGNFPNQFSFEACQYEFSAVLEKLN
jgi:V8-like Glu-specific endopeptidase